MEKLYDGECKLMEILWAHAPVNSTRPVALCRERLDRNKSTTYTVLRKLKTKGAVRHEDATVCVLLTREAAIGEQNRDPERRAGGLSPFMTAFLGGRRLTQKEAEELKRLLHQSGDPGVVSVHAGEIA